MFGAPTKFVYDFDAFDSLVITFVVDITSFNNTHFESAHGGSPPSTPPK